MPAIPRPLYRDPVFDGAADPVLVWNRAEQAWWMVYTSRRAKAPDLPGVSWIHGTDLGVASSTDGGATWLYRGVIQGLDTEWGRHTYWAPEIVDDGTTYHMYVSTIRGVPAQWAGHERHIRHYSSPDLVTWRYHATLALSSDYVIDACVAARPGGGYRMWYKDEADRSHTWAADSDDLYAWRVRGPAVRICAHEGPNVFTLGGFHWMLVDEWHGQRVLRSDDMDSWQPQGLILDAPGRHRDDATVGLHADVVVRGDDALVFYFTHPERRPDTAPATYATRRTSIQVARVAVEDGRLVCDRDESLSAPILPPGPGDGLQ
ncbi:glycoside hydrolase family protein [Plantactinospora soyae]|uniref:Glycosyl hydrolase n=1 Tax=Plantactinospora soyae TaxID=1544732 RepID=A0A927MAF9_9ACTN|nr:hypothetical protein [Plantactinospora soyae]MBE1490834.1 hypothetical protein [Plantactinospora soyae]